jgi:hypothetical protein
MIPKPMQLPAPPAQAPGGKSTRARSEFRLLAALLTAAGLLAGCGASGRQVTASPIPKRLLAQARPIGPGPRFSPPVSGPAGTPCTTTLGPRVAAHIELFAANRVVIVAAGIGIKGPEPDSTGRITHARCYGPLVTLEPTGVVLVRARAHVVLATLFAAWGQPLSRSRLASFGPSPGAHVTVFVDGTRWLRSPGSVPIGSHAEIVAEIGRYVPPHTHFTFASGS